MEGQLTGQGYRVDITPNGVWPANEKRNDQAIQVVSLFLAETQLLKASGLYGLVDDAVGLADNAFNAAKNSFQNNLINIQI